MKFEDILLKWLKEQNQKKEVEIDENTLLFETGILDSLIIIQLLLYIADTFQCEISMEDLTVQNFSNVTQISNLLKKYVGEKE